MDPFLSDALKKLEPFADPHAEGRHFSATPRTPTTVDVRMVCRGAELKFAVEASTDTAVVRRGPRTQTLRHFLAGPELADLNSLAGIVASYWQADYIDSLGSLREGRDAGKEQSAVNLICELVAVTNGATQIVFVTAAAGGGKSRTLQRVAQVAANAFSVDEPNAHLFLYVDAQARALARFDEALAVSLDQFRSRLTFDQVVPLVREGLLVVIVDGFDELLETGKVDTVASLTDFVRELKGDGAVVLSGRSAYYETEFGAKIANDSGSWELSRVEVIGWDEQQTADYIRRDAASLDSAKLFSAAAMMSDGRRASPFFVSTLVDLKMEGGPSHATVSTLVIALAEREANIKLKDLSGSPILTTEDLLTLAEDIAIDLWLAETRTLKDRDLRDVIAAVIPGVQLDLLKYVQQRGPFLAFFAAEQGRSGFRHEIWFEYFVARHIAKRLATDRSALRWILPRAPCSQTTADLAVSESGGRTRYADGALVTELQRLTFAGEKSPALGRDNIGRLCAAALRAVQQAKDWTLEDLSFSDETLRDLIIDGLALRRCTFTGCDIRGAVLRGSAESVSFDRVKVDDRTRLELRGPFQILSLQTLSILYDPTKISDWLSHHGGPQGTAAPIVQQCVIDLLERLAGQLQTRNVFWPDDDWFKWLHHRDEWEAVRAILEQTQVLVFQRSENRRAPRERLHATVKLSDVVAALGGVPTDDERIANAAAALAEQFAI